MDWTRREILKHSSHVAAGLTLGPWLPNLSFASVGRSGEGFFMLLRTFGGMDVTLGLDPWILPAGCDEKDMFVEYRPENIIEASGLRLGPAAASLATHAADCAIINGVMMRRDAGHDVINLYMATGRGDGKAASLPVELSLATGAGPYGVLINTAAYLAGKAASLSSTNDILNDKDGEALIQITEEKLQNFPTQKQTPFIGSQKDLVAARSQTQALKKILGDFSAKTQKLDEKHVAAAAFASGCARHALLDFPGQPFALDTHSNHERTHLGAQREIWNWVSEVFTLFKQTPYGTGNLFDATTFMVMSEWSRTPALNAAKGKDHNPFTNSVLFAGRGIKGGSVVGASRLIPRGTTGTGYADHIAHPFDYAAGKLAESTTGASFIFPENVIRTVGEIFGNPASFAPVPSSTALIPGLLRT